MLASVRWECVVVRRSRRGGRARPCRRRCWRCLRKQEGDLTEVCLAIFVPEWPIRAQAPNNMLCSAPFVRFSQIFFPTDHAEDLHDLIGPQIGRFDSSTRHSVTNEYPKVCTPVLPADFPSEASDVQCRHKVSME